MFQMGNMYLVRSPAKPSSKDWIWAGSAAGTLHVGTRRSNFEDLAVPERSRPLFGFQQRLVVFEVPEGFGSSLGAARLHWPGHNPEGACM